MDQIFHSFLFPQCDIPHRSGKCTRAHEMVEILNKFPKLNLSANVRPITPSVLRVEVTITPDFEWDDAVHKKFVSFWVSLAEDQDQEKILHQEYFVLKKQFIDENHNLSFTVPIYNAPLPCHYFIKVDCQKWFLHVLALPPTLVVPLTQLILPEEYPPPTELVDLQPLLVTAFHNPSYEALYLDFMHFNSIQTQVFPALYDSDDNVLVAAPTGSGKTICAEFAILRNHQKGSNSVMRAVYIEPIEALANQRCVDWEKKFGGGLKLRVVELTGDRATDLKLLKKGQIVISSPEKWDALSRHWKQERHVQEVSLFIIDQLHLIGGQGGPVLEVIVSRMRYIATHSENKIRFVALSTSLANAKDLGEWIGATSHSVFNFPLGARPVPLEIQIEGVHINNIEARIMEMAKISYAAVTNHGKNGEPAIVFVPTSDHVGMTAAELLSYSKGDNAEKQFLLRSSKEIEPFLDKVSDRLLSVALRKGVGYLHEDLNNCDHDIVSQLFEDGFIQVCVLSSSMCWGATLSAHLVVVMGTQYHDGGNCNYSLADLLQMTGQAGRPLDNSGQCIILCHTPLKEYYKTFLGQALPVESHLHHSLHVHLNAEIVAGFIENHQDAVDYVAETFMYKRLYNNPSYYNLEAVSHTGVSIHVSKLVEDTLDDLEASGCIAFDWDGISPSNLGRIASDFYISYKTVGKFSTSLNRLSSLEDILEVLSSSCEYDGIAIRQLAHEEEEIRNLINRQRFAYDNGRVTDPHVKALALLQAHFSRLVVGINLARDQREILTSADKLLQAIVEFLSEKRWLRVTLFAIAASQMVMQGMWHNDSLLLQLPHFTRDLAIRCHDRNVKDFDDILNLDLDEKREMLNMSDSVLLEIIEYIRRYPNPKVRYEVRRSSSFPKIEIEVVIKLTEEVTDKMGTMWLLVGDTDDHLLAIKSLQARTIAKEVRVILKFMVQPETKSYDLYFFWNSYKSCGDSFRFTVAEIGD